jgi:hypothetical protein
MRDMILRFEISKEKIKPESNRNPENTNRIEPRDSESRLTDISTNRVSPSGHPLSDLYFLMTYEIDYCSLFLSFHRSSKRCDPESRSECQQRLNDWLID